MKRRRVVAALLATYLGVSTVLGGCAGTGNADAGKIETSQMETGKASEAVTTQESVPEELVKLELVTGDNVPLPEDSDNFVNQALEEALGIDVTMNILGAGADYATALNARISGGDAPDIFLLPNKDAMYQYAKNGVILGLNEYKEQIRPVIDWAGGEENLRAGMYEGELYVIPEKVAIVHTQWVVRQDWLDKVGAKVPTTLDEVLEVAKKLTFEDPDGNGKDDTYGFSSKGLERGYDGVMNSYGVSVKNHFVIRNGEVMSSLLLPEMKPGLEMCKKFVDAGVVDPDIIANDTQTVRDKMTQGKIGMAPYDWSGIYKQMYLDQIKEVDPKANWVYIAPPSSGTDAPPAYGLNDVSNTAGTWCISAEVAEDPNKLQAVFDLLNYLVTDEGQRLVCYGIEGRHYNLVDGQVERTELMSKECDFLWVYAITHRDDSTYLPLKFPEAKGAIEFANNTTKLEIYDTAVITPEGFHKEDMDKYIQDNMISFIYGKRPIGEYDQFIQELNDSFQFEEYLQSAKEQIKEKGYIQ